LIDRGATVLVLSRGMELVLQTAPESLKWLEQNGLQHFILETREAAKLYAKIGRLTGNPMARVDAYQPTSQIPMVARPGDRLGVLGNGKSRQCARQVSESAG